MLSLHSLSRISFLLNEQFVVAVLLAVVAVATVVVVVGIRVHIFIGITFLLYMSCLSLSFISLNGSMVSRSKAFDEMEMFHCIRHLMFQNIAYMPFTMTIVNLPCGTDFIRYISYFPF